MSNQHSDVPLIPPQTPDQSQTAPGDASDIFRGSASMWIGLRTFVAVSLLEILSIAGIFYGVLYPKSALGAIPLIAGIALLMASNLMLVYSILVIRSQRYTITRRLIERERGLIVKRVDSLDLGRVKDIELKQSIFERMFNIGTIEVFSSDQTDPMMLIEAIPNPRPVYEQLRDAVISISQRRGVIPM